ncbi:MAG TPA: hypothetical protein V6C99_07505 [Oculatellaceae cyanobacterium]|jgi:hypothetical protein
MIERSEAMKVMDQLEALLLKQGWPVPFTPYYLVHHTKMLQLLDQLRDCLQDEVDGRFIKAFTAHREKSLYQPKSKGKERSH